MQPALFTLLSERSSWLAQRQAVLAQNIANADTPGYSARDVVGFEEALASAGMAPTPVALAGTHAGHLAGPAASQEAARSHRVRTYETAPSGNAVVLEEEAQKQASARLDHELALELYGKNMTMMKIAIGASS